MEQTYENYQTCAACSGMGMIDDAQCEECEGAGIVSPHHQYEHPDPDRRYDEG